MAPETVTLRAHGIGRFFEAGFLAIWLTGWVAGEAFALAALGSILLALFGFLADSRIAEFSRENRDAAPLVIPFLSLWLTFWTIGGIAAWWTFFRRLAGVDRIAIDGSTIAVMRQGGPIRRRRRIERTEVRRIRMQRPGGSLVADTPSGTHVLSDLGTPAERESLASSIRSQLQLAVAASPGDPTVAPAGWRLEPPDESGAPRLTRPRGGRTIVGAVMWTLAGTIAYAAAQAGSPHPWGTALLVALLAIAAAWVCWAREEWILRPYRLKYRLRFGPWLRLRAFDGGHLELSHSTDSDGDSRYRLQVRDATGKKVVDSALHDDTELRDLANWMEAVTKMRLRT